MKTVKKWVDQTWNSCVHELINKEEAMSDTVRAVREEILNKAIEIVSDSDNVEDDAYCKLVELKEFLEGDLGYGK